MTKQPPAFEAAESTDFIHPMHGVEIDGLDAGIADAVHLLRRHGVDTFASCEGGEGHAFKNPTIRIKPMRPAELQHLRFEKEEIARILTNAGYSGFYIKLVDCFQATAEPWQPETMSFIEVEFWAEARQLGAERD